MEGPRRDSKWWGWGDPAVAPELDAEALATLRERVGELEPSPLKGDLEGFELPPAQPLPPALVEAIGAESVFDSTEDRVRHATGRGYVDLARLRQGRLDAARPQCPRGRRSDGRPARPFREVVQRIDP